MSLLTIRVISNLRCLTLRVFRKVLQYDIICVPNMVVNQPLIYDSTRDGTNGKRSNNLQLMYPQVDYVVDPPAVKVVERFRSRLREVSAAIKQRNTLRKIPYTILDPENIPNSIAA